MVTASNPANNFNTLGEASRRRRLKVVLVSHLPVKFRVFGPLALATCRSLGRHCESPLIGMDGHVELSGVWGQVFVPPIIQKDRDGENCFSVFRWPQRRTS